MPAGPAAAPLRPAFAAALAAVLTLAASARPAAAQELETAAEDGVLSMKNNATIRIGGEAFVDLSYKTRDAAPTIDPATGLRDQPNGRLRRTDFEATTANLRFVVTPAPLQNMKFILKLNLADAWDKEYDQDDLLEECRFVFDNVCGTGWSFLFGKGEAPFGQDRTLGIIQSYAHNADRYDSSEGPISLLADPDWITDDPAKPQRPVGEAGAVDRFPHPGEVDRVFMAGAAFAWRDILKAEFALFQNDRRLDGRHSADNGFESMALRVWWTPVEHLTLEASGIRMQSGWMGDGDHRPELADGGDARDASYAISLGADWRPGPWEFFAEYLHGFNWNHTKDYSTDQASLGGLFHFSGRWSLGAMAEWLRLRDPKNGMRREDYYKLVASLRYTMPSGFFMIGEVGHEWFRGKYSDARRSLEGDATLLAMRAGWQF